MLIGVVGTIAAGKSTIVSVLEEQGFTKISLSNMLRDRALSRGLKIDRDTLYALGNELRQKFGPACLMEEAINRAAKDPGDYAIDAVRTVREVQLLREQPASFVIAVDADVKLRFERAKERESRTDREENAHTLTEFMEHEEREESEDAHKAQIRSNMEGADVLIMNEGSISELKEKVLKALESFKAKALTPRSASGNNSSTTSRHP